MKDYKCKNPVLMCVFNRPDNAIKVFNEVKKVKPSKLYLVCDGIRNEKDSIKVKECRDIADLVDWDCKVIKIFSDNNLGCKKRIITGITEAFNHEEKLIILEDDCVPTLDFFKFVDECLDKYEEEDNIAIVSGSNLLDYKYKEKYKNGFSMYINCWGWATWKRTWDLYDSFLSIQELNKSYKRIMKEKPLSYFEKKYWLYIFRHSIYTRTIWDFYLQFFFFKYNLYSIYPTSNLVYNVGFSEESTHMTKEPEYVVKSKPNKNNIEIMNSKDYIDFKKDNVNINRDKDVLRILYGYSLLSCFKIKMGNILRYHGVIK